MTMSRNKLLSLLVVSGLVGISTVSANFMVTGFTWNVGNGNWSVPGNWTPAGGPPDDPGDTAAINTAVTVTLNASYTIGSLSIGHASALLAMSNNSLSFGSLTNSGTIEASGGTSNALTGPVTNNGGAVMRIVGGSGLTITAATLANSGTINVNHNQAGANTFLNFPNSTSISGSGRIQLSQGGTWAYLTSTGTLTNGAGHTIGGRGIVLAPIVNNGNITADWNGATLSVTTGGVANNATIQAQSGGTLGLDAVTINQSPTGQIVANGGNIGIRNGTIISGGLFSTVTGSAIYADVGTCFLNNITNNGEFNIAANRVVTVGAGVFVNAGLININYNAAGSNTSLNFTSPLSITGGGVIQMSQAGTWAELTSDPGVLITNSSTHTIQGRGRIGALLANAGMISANWGNNELILRDQAKTNTGTIQSAGGYVIIDGCTLTQSGAGQLYANTTSVGVRNGASITGGTFNSNGGNAISFDLGNASISNFTNNGNMFISANKVITVGAGLFANNGTINLNQNQAGSNTSIHFTEDTALSGNGVIQMSQGGTWAQLTTAVGKVVTQQPNHTIKGRGEILAGLSNFGVVSADWSGATLRLTDAPKSNANIIKASSGGVLSIDGCGITQTGGGTIFADTGDIGIRNGASITGGSLTANTGAFYCDSATVSIANLTNSAPLNIQGGAGLNASGTITNNATINLNYNQSGNPTLLTATDNLVFAGTGVLQMSQAGSWADLATDPGKTITNSVSHTIKGRGQITGALTNDGVVSADWGSATLELIGSAKTNNGTMQSNISSGALSIRDCAITQSANATIYAKVGNVGLRGTASVTGGKFQSDPTFGIYVDAGAPTVDGVTSTAAVNIDGGKTLNIGAGGYVNNGSVNINYTQSGATTIMRAAADCTISGTGLIQMSQSTTWAQIVADTGATITFDSGQTVQGRGQLVGSFINKGAVRANWGSNTLFINPSGAGFKNRGVLESGVSSSSLTINSANLFTNETGGAFTTNASHVSTVNGGDYKQTGGSTIVNGQLNVTGGNKVDITGGTLGGSGIVNCAVANNGTGEASPGNSAGKLRIQGTYTQGANAKTLIELGGTTQTTQYDLLEVTGTVSLNGTLRLKLINGFTPTPADTFTIITGSAVSGSFSNVTVEGGSIDLEPSVVYSANSVTVTFLTKVDPMSFAITGGVHAGGNLTSLLFSDDNRLLLQCDEFDDVGVLEVTTTSPIASPTKLRFAFESSASRADLTEILDLWNYTTNQWVTIPPSAVTTMTDRRRVFVVTSNVGQFVKLGTAEMKARIRWIPQNDNGAIDGWNIRVDQTIWFVGP